MTACPNTWPCHRPAEEHPRPPAGCVHHATSGTYADAEPAGEDR